MSKFIELTTWQRYGGAGGRMYINKDSIIEVHEASDGSHCILIIRNGKKEPDIYQVVEPFETIKAMMDYDPAVADIVRKGSGI